MVSCDKETSQGCNGGWPDKSYEYIGKQGTNGIDTEESYPYTAEDSECDTEKTSDGQDVAAMCTGPQAVAETEEALQEAVGNVGPVSICLAASSMGFGQYK